MIVSKTQGYRNVQWQNKSFKVNVCRKIKQAFFLVTSCDLTPMQNLTADCPLFKQDTSLADLLQLNLHCFEEEVRGIVDKAVKEMGMEKVLSELNSTWTGGGIQTSIATVRSLVPSALYQGLRVSYPKTQACSSSTRHTTAPRCPCCARTRS